MVAQVGPEMAFKVLAFPKLVLVIVRHEGLGSAFAEHVHDKPLNLSPEALSLHV
jgi:hypothetical protein